MKMNDTTITLPMPLLNEKEDTMIDLLAEIIASTILNEAI